MTRLSASPLHDTHPEYLEFEAELLGLLAWGRLLEEAEPAGIG